MKILKILKCAIHPIVFFKSKKIKKYTFASDKLYISKKERSFKFKKNQLKNINLVVDHCKKIFNEKKTSILENYKPPTHVVIGPRGDKKINVQQIKELKPILKFAAQPTLMGLVSNYIGQIPIMVSATLTYTKAMKPTQKPINFQKFHTDMLDESLLHLVIPIDNISVKNGPFTYIDAPMSSKIMKKIRYEGGRVEDNIIKKYAKKKNIVKLSGNRGQAWLMSPYYSFHMGARVEEGHRLMLIICYGSPNMAIEHERYLHRPDIQEALLGKNSSELEKNLLRLYN